MMVVVVLSGVVDGKIGGVRHCTVVKLSWLSKLCVAGGMSKDLLVVTVDAACVFLWLRDSTRRHECEPLYRERDLGHLTPPALLPFVDARHSLNAKRRVSCDRWFPRPSFLLCLPTLLGC